MKAIYLVLTTIFPKGSSTSYPFTYDHVSALKRFSKYEVIILKASKIYESIKDYHYKGLDVHCFPHIMMPSKKFNRLNVFEIERTLKRLSINPRDIAFCHLHGGQGILGTAIQLKEKYRQITTIRQYQDSDPLIFQRSKYFKLPLFSKRWKATALAQTNLLDLHIGVSNKPLATLERLPGVHLKNKYVLYNGIDTSKFYPMMALRPKDGFHIGCIGTFNTTKDQITLIQAAEHLIEGGMDDLQINLIGSGPAKQRCQEYVNRNSKFKNRIFFLSEIEHHKLVNFYNCLDLFVLPSYDEAFGCVYTEAYACGIPFMAIRGQGIEEFIPDEDKDKWLIEPHDFRGLAQKIKAFREKRFQQRLKFSIDISSHVKNYLNFLENTFP